MKLFLTRSESAALRRCIAMLQVSRSGFALSLLLGVTALGAAIALGGTAAWLIARASQQPPVLYLTVAATSVRLFGVSRALARYLSRLASHKVALTTCVTTFTTSWLRPRVRSCRRCAEAIS